MSGCRVLWDCEKHLFGASHKSPKSVMLKSEVSLTGRWEKPPRPDEPAWLRDALIGSGPGTDSTLTGVGDGNGRGSRAGDEGMHVMGAGGSTPGLLPLKSLSIRSSWCLYKSVSPDLSAFQRVIIFTSSLIHHASVEPYLSSLFLILPQPVSNIANLLSPPLRVSHGSFPLRSHNWCSTSSITLHVWRARLSENLLKMYWPSSSLILY